ncbi:putative alpha beta hydrolase fold-3 domain protein [Phaeoacremonium minimum UCRPA7]|uniref:Putative alpha beta hydrolase fold-3 domain protein n=1 Tax=Phaeoacremonium minimum (strain UCR-PA7) TaxID=1286976 RepID=R8BN47_PHAM7|nr:putative alpha beta hydrolase fold-3 domain protein [Phaeoacremonium minimum UCRPA7]EOO00757.1 putative alpha beta hydrolase fold-3 domain protein [Phaeoacremonium minimum UCRPA7]
MATLRPCFEFAGKSLWPDWLPIYLLEYAEQHSTPLISADYRLLPECQGLDILDDLEVFWGWVRRDNDGLQAFLNSKYPSLALDTDRILAEGESAGGYLVVQAALSGLPGLKAVISAYPMLDLRDRYYREAFEKVMTGVPMLPPEIITEHLKSMKKGDIVSQSLPPARMDLGTAIIQQGRFCEFLGDEDVLYPVDRLRLGLHSSGTMPRLWIYHGKQDTGIPSAGSVVFAKEAKRLWPESELRLDLPDGEHGVHKDKHVASTTWLREGLAWLEEPWLK